jgi:hypothetical protein
MEMGSLQCIRVMRREAGIISACSDTAHKEVFRSWESHNRRLDTGTSSLFFGLLLYWVPLFL